MGGAISLLATHQQNLHVYTFTFCIFTHLHKFLSTHTIIMWLAPGSSHDLPTRVQVLTILQNMNDQLTIPQNMNNQLENHQCKLHTARHSETLDVALKGDGNTISLSVDETLRSSLRNCERHQEEDQVKNRTGNSIPPLHWKHLDYPTSHHLILTSVKRGFSWVKKGRMWAEGWTPLHGRGYPAPGTRERTCNLPALSHLPHKATWMLLPKNPSPGKERGVILPFTV